MYVTKGKQSLAYWQTFLPAALRIRNSYLTFSEGLQMIKLENFLQNSKEILMERIY